jgi:hypothetical protein
LAAHVLHIGMDDCHRVEVLRSVGYRVDEVASLPQLAAALSKTGAPLAVVLTETEAIPPAQAVSIAREHSAAPVIFFPKSNYGVSEDEFDLVIQPLTSPEKWLQDVSRLLEWSRVVRADAKALTNQSRSLRKQTSILRNESEQERKRSVRERTRNSGLNPSDPWNSTGSN